MAASQFKSGTLSTTAGGVEDVVTAAAETTAGVFQFFTDLAAMVNGDVMVLRVKEKATGAGDTQRDIWRAQFANAQGAPMAVSPSLILLHGWDFSITQTAGASRSVPWSIRQA